MILVDHYYNMDHLKDELGQSGLDFIWEGIKDVHSTGFGSDITELDDLSGCTFLVANTSGGKLLGFIAYYWEDGSCIVEQLSWVHPNWRGKGVYTELKEELLVEARRNGGSVRVESGVAAGNTRMRSILEKRGAVMATIWYRKDV